jgi:hypothetical protein
MGYLVFQVESRRNRTFVVSTGVVIRQRQCFVKRCCRVTRGLFDGLIGVDEHESGSSGTVTRLRCDGIGYAQCISSSALLMVRSRSEFAARLLLFDGMWMFSSLSWGRPSCMSYRRSETECYPGSSSRGIGLRLAPGYKQQTGLSLRSSACVSHMLWRMSANLDQRRHYRPCSGFTSLEGIGT